MRKTTTKFEDIEIKTSFFGHLGLISAYFEELGLVGLFDELIPKTRVHKITHGEAILVDP